MDSIWANGGAPATSHLFHAVFFAFGFVVVRFFLDRFIFRHFKKFLLVTNDGQMCHPWMKEAICPIFENIENQQRLAILLLQLGTTHLRNDEATRGKIVKCSESMWKFAYYATVEFFVLKVAYHAPWFLNVKEYFRGWPNQELSAGIKLIYMCQCGFYLYSIAALLVWETRRKDFAVMMSHHIVTVLLISLSYISSFFRIGIVILALHDASDVFLEAAKVFKYSEKELGASVLFGCFAVSWLILRLVLFPFWVIRSSSYYLCEVLKLSEAYDTMIYYFFNTMLLTLLVFHIYWWILICSMVMKQLRNRGKVGEDIRSDSEDDD